MKPIRIINEEEVLNIINLNMAIKADENAYIQKNTNNGSVWPLVFYEWEHGIFDMDIRSGNLDKSNAYGLKLLSYNEHNKEKNIDIVNAISLVIDSNTGVPIALLNAKSITNYRTGAASAVGAKYLANKDSENLLVIGSGNIAVHSTAAMILVMPNIKNIMVYGGRGIISKDKFTKFKEKVLSILKDKINKDITFNIVNNLEFDTKKSDIIITATSSEKPIIKSDWLKKGVHLSCMGAGLEGRQEIDENIFKISKNYADDEKQCLSCGEAQVANKKNILSKFDGEIGEIILGTKEGRTSHDDITLFDSTGLFLQDLATSIEIIKIAEEKEIGTVINI